MHSYSRIKFLLSLVKKTRNNWFISCFFRFDKKNFVSQLVSPISFRVANFFNPLSCFNVVLLWFLFSCGLPDPLGFNQNNLINPVINVETYSSNNSIFMNITGLNSERNFPNYLGYIVYISPIAEDNNNRKILLFDDLFRLPTISSFSSEQEVTERIILRRLYWTNITNGDYEDGRNLGVGDRYYFRVKPHRINQSVDFNINNLLEYSETVETNLFNQNLAAHQSFSFSNVSFSISNNTFTPISGNFQSLGYKKSWFDIRTAPISGYSFYPFQIQENTMIVFSYSNYYGKVYLKNVTPSLTVFDFSYQVISNHLEI